MTLPLSDCHQLWIDTSMLSLYYMKLKGANWASCLFKYNKYLKPCRILSTKNTLYCGELMILPWGLIYKHINPRIRKWSYNPTPLSFEHVVLFVCFASSLFLPTRQDWKKSLDLRQIGLGFWNTPPNQRGKGISTEEMGSWAAAASHLLPWRRLKSPKEGCFIFSLF